MGNISAVRFFVYGGILALPYQFCHHAHKMQCDHGQVFSFFLSDTLRHVPAGQPPRMVRAVCTVPTLCHATHFGLLCSLCAVLTTCVLNMSVFYVCLSVCRAGGGGW